MPNSHAMIVDELDQYLRTDVDGSEVASIIETAAAARNGWKVILARVASPNLVNQPASRPERQERAGEGEVR